MLSIEVADCKIHLGLHFVFLKIHIEIDKYRTKTTSVRYFTYILIFTIKSYRHHLCKQIEYVNILGHLLE